MTKALIAEPGAGEMLEALRGAGEILCVSIGYVEVRAMIARRLSARAASRARPLLDEYWQAIQTVAVDDRLIARAADVADAHRLRSLDALHLAAALEIGEPPVVLATWDAELGQAARDSGLATIPA